MDRRTYLVPEQNWDSLCTKVEKLSRRASKIGVKIPVLNKVGEEFVEDSKGNVLYLAYKVEVESEPVSISGWQFIATIEMGDAEIGLVINKAPGVMDNTDLPANFRTTTNYCDHCQKNVRRNSVYVLRHLETGEFKQVGRNCLGLFLGGVDPENVVAQLEYIQRFESLFYIGDGCSGAREWDSVHAMLSTTHFVMGEKGWVSRKIAREQNRQATADLVSFLLYVPETSSESFEDKEMRRKFREYRDDNPLNKNEQLIDNIIDWVRNLKDEECNDYLHNLRVACALDVARIKHIGIVASAISAYQRAMGLLEQKKQTAQDIANLTHIGVEGQKDTFTLTVRDIKYWANNFGGVTAVLMEDSSGNKVIWKATNNPNLEIGKTYSVTGKVKSHTKFGLIPQTELTRCKMILV